MKLFKNVNGQNVEVTAAEIAQMEAIKIEAAAHRKQNATATAASMRLALLEAGRLQAVEDVVATNKAAQIEWEYRTTYNRSSPLIAAMSGPAGFTATEIDALFERVQEIEAGA